MLFTPLPIVTSFKFSQPAKTLPPIVCTPSGITTEVRLLQSKKVPSPIFVTEFPIVMEDRPLHPENALNTDTQYFAL